MFDKYSEEQKMFLLKMQEKNKLYIKTQSVPRSKHSVSVIKTSQLMLYREIIAVCSQIHTKHKNTLCGQNVEWLNVNPLKTNRICVI